MPGQVQGQQVRDRQQQPRQMRRCAGSQCSVVVRLQGTGSGQVVAAGFAAFGVGTAPDPRQPGLGDHLADPGPVQPDPLAGQHGTDLVDGVPLSAQGDDPFPGGVLARGALGAGPGTGEEVPRPRTEVGHSRVKSGDGVPEPCRDARSRLTVQQVGP